MVKLQLASYNRGKIDEFRALLDGLALDLVTPFDLDIFIKVPEVGSSYAENAAIKAHTFAQQTNLPTLADDSGLEVEVLDNAPGIFSARYDSNPDASDSDRRLFLLKQLENHPRPWKARFHCTIAIAEPGGQTHFSEGICLGEVIPQERGENGFGYDPIFLIPEFGKTMAELNMDEKNRVSHRAKAVAKAIPIILELLK